jgi:lipoyl(octanoyl) transferase
MAVFEKLVLWLDRCKRPGPEAMAVDEWLLETAVVPVLRVYGWLGNWGSLGYFGKFSDARLALPGVDWVRRWTGGGIVDHRADWTYTLVAPAGEPLCMLRGAENYRVIHAALARALAEEGINAFLSAGDQQTGAALCFGNPVGHDLVDGSGRKIAGAGQRRTKSGLLHQGSLALPSRMTANSLPRAACLAGALAGEWEYQDFMPPLEAIECKIRTRYASAAWTQRC